MIYQDTKVHISTPLQPRSENLSHCRARKRKFVQEEPFIDGVDSAYPSPPMSSPPSPPRKPPGELSEDSVRALREEPAPLRGPIETFAPALTTTLPATESAPAPAYFSQPSSHTPFASGPPAAYAPLTDLPPPISREPWPAEYSAFAGPTFPTTPNRPTASAAPRGRRSKTHVASACVNCKRAHLSCDVNRPCARCVASGKQDTCVDVQHKKRGRPRLREEGEPRAEQPAVEAGPQSATPSGPPQALGRPIATTRHRRGESFRSLRSQTSEGSETYTTSTPGTYPPTAPRQSPFGAPLPPTPVSARPGYEVATALLTLDFVIIRTNRPFQQIMLPGQDLRGRQIADVAAPADNENFQAIRNSLRAEREAREPAYMPPILQPGQDPVQNIPEVEAERYAYGFQDHTYTWTHTRLGPASQRFPVRIRLAKASTYFVVVTLPSFRPVEPPPQPQAPVYSGHLPLGPPLQPQNRFWPSREAAQTAPPPGYTFQGPTASYLPQQFHGPGQYASARTYSPSQAMMPHLEQSHLPYQPLAPDTPRLPVAEPPTETTAFTPRTAPRELIAGGRTAALQLPPIVGSPAPAGQAAGRAHEEDEASTEEQELRSPKKRRRVGIHDVLQR